MERTNRTRSTILPKVKENKIVIKLFCQIKFWLTVQHLTLEIVSLGLNRKLIRKIIQNAATRRMFLFLKVTISVTLSSKVFSHALS